MQPENHAAWLTAVGPDDCVWWNDPTGRLNGSWRVAYIQPRTINGGKQPSEMMLTLVNDRGHEAQANPNEVTIVDLSERYPEDDWRYDVTEGNTLLSYREWVPHQASIDDFPQPIPRIDEEGRATLELRFRVAYEALDDADGLRELADRLVSISDNALEAGLVTDDLGGVVITSHVNVYRVHEGEIVAHMI